MNKQYRLHRIECVRCCVFVFVFYRTIHGNIVLEQGLREIFGLKTEGVAGDGERGAAWFVLVSEWWWVVS